MKYLFNRLVSLLFISTSLVYGNFEVNGFVGVNSQSYLKAPSSKYANNFTMQQELEVKYFNDNLSVYSKVYAQEDSHDLRDKQNERTFVRLDELYLKYDFDNDMLSAGKSIKFWGSLEVKNIVDGFNAIDLRVDLFELQKLGAYNLTYSHYTDSGEISAIIKIKEQNQEMAAPIYVYNFFPEFVSYDANINTSKNKYRPSVFLKYSGSTETEYALDYAFIYENGYDSQRYFLADGILNGSPVNYNQHSYIVDKFMTYNTLVVNSTLIKLEALYAKVDDDKYIGDYSHIGFGLEHTIENYMGSDVGVGLIAEYYRYITFEDDKYTDLEIFETMQNDLFVGVRYSFNNANDTNIIGGVIADIQYDEQVYYLKFASRAYDSLKIEVDAYLIEPSKEKATAYSFLKKHQRIALNIAWYF